MLPAYLAFSGRHEPSGIKTTGVAFYKYSLGPTTSFSQSQGKIPKDFALRK